MNVRHPTGAEPEPSARAEQSVADRRRELLYEVKGDCGWSRFGGARPLEPHQVGERVKDDPLLPTTSISLPRVRAALPRQLESELVG